MVIKTHTNTEHPKKTAAAEELLTGAKCITFEAHTEVSGGFTRVVCAVPQMDLYISTEAAIRQSGQFA